VFNNLPIQLTQSEKSVLAAVLRPNPVNDKFTKKQCLTVILISAGASFILSILTWFVFKMSIENEIGTVLTTITHAIANVLNAKDVYIAALLLGYFYMQNVAEKRAALLRKFHAYLSNSSSNETHIST
jgi:MFS-type transporter involved in bile tolerance (Atg22 family)